MPMRSKTTLLCLTAVFALLPIAHNAAAAGAIILEKKFPTQKERVRIQVMDDNGSLVTGADVSVTYRPGSRVSATDSLGQTDAGTLHWTPTDAGLATITATWQAAGQTQQSSSTTVSIRFASAPIDGLIIMIAAGLVLIVGSVIRVYKLVRAPDFN